MQIQKVLERAAILLLTATLVSACGKDESPAAEAAAPAAVTGEREAPTAVDDNQAASGRTASGDLFAYAEVDGELARGYLSYPADMIEPLPALLIVHDRFGLDQDMRDICDQIASQGFVVLGVDLFGGIVGKKPAETRQVQVRLLEKPDLARENLQQAIEFLDSSVGAPRIAIQGWGFGGIYALNTAISYPDKLSAAILVQGQTITDAEKLALLKMPLLGIYGAGDRSIPATTVRAFGDALKASRISHDIRLYPAAASSFMIPGGGNYSESQAANAWEIIDEFLASNLAEAP